MPSFFFTRLSILFFFPIISLGQENQPTGNNLFDLLNKPVTSPDVKKLNEFYGMAVKDSVTRFRASKGIEYQLKNGKIKTIILHKNGGDWSSYSHQLPLGMHWGMKEADIVEFFGEKENGLPYHYDKNLDINPIYEPDAKQLSSIELKFTNYFETDSKEKDDDALLALFLSDPQKFKYLKSGISDKENRSAVFNRSEFKKQISNIIQIYADKKSDQLKGNFLYELKTNTSTTRYYASTFNVKNVVNQYIELKEILPNPGYLIVLEEFGSAKAASLPAEVVNKYDNWVGVIKELLISPWTYEDAEVYEGIIDKGITFENKTSQTTSGGFTYYKYPLIDIYIVYKKDHYSIELKIY